MGAVGCGTLGKLSPIAFAASLHAVPQTAPATSIIDEALERGAAALQDISKFISNFIFAVDISPYMKVNI